MAEKLDLGGEADVSTRSDEQVEPLLAELGRLFACPQVRQPAPGAKIFFNKDSKRPLAQQPSAPSSGTWASLSCARFC